MQEIEVWVIVDEDGEYAVATEQDAAEEAYDESVGGSDCRRAIKITLKVPLPKPIELRGEVPEEPVAGCELKAV